MIRRVDIITMGCSKNLVDSEHLLYQLKAGGFRTYHNPKRLHGDVAVVNTCGFINDAKEESINMILYLCKARREGKLKRLYVIGCLSERFFRELNKEIPEVDRYFGKFDWQGVLRELHLQYDPSCADKRLITTPSHYAYLKIAEGCDRKCAYCAIPIITGPHKSRPMENIIEEVKALVSQGVKEFQVIAQELTYYGLDLYGKRRLAELVCRISDVPGVEWIRLHYGYPHQFPMDLIPVIKERSNVCHYLDIALQHSSDVVLQRMHRHTTRVYQRDLMLRLREEIPDICLRTTFMVGFPGETDQNFEDLMNFTREIRFDRMGAFSYSEEEGTYAAAHYEDDVPPTVKQERLSRLMQLQQDIAVELCEKKVGQTLRVIIDREEEDYFIGRTQYDSPEVDGEVLIPRQERKLQTGSFYNVKITGTEDFDLIGTTLTDK